MGSASAIIGSKAIWDPRDGTLKQEFVTAVNSPIAICKNRNLAAVYNEDSDSLSILDTSTEANRSIIKVNPNRRFRNATFSGDGSTFLFVSWGENVMRLELWNVDQERLLWTWKFNTESHVQFRDVIWNADDSCFAAFGKIGEEYVYVFDAVQGTLKRRIVSQHESGKIYAVAWCVDGRLLAFGTKEASEKIGF